MTTTQCSQFEEILEQQPDGPLPAAATAHLDACPDCRLLWRDIDIIRVAGREWGTDEPAPPARLWVALRAQLESEGLIRQAKQPGWLGAWFGSAPRLAVAGAYLSLLLIAAALVGFQNHQSLEQAAGGTTAEAPALTATVVPDLGQTLDGNMQRVMASLPQRDPSLASSLQKNLGIVDNLIAVCEKSVHEQPDNAVAREYLYGAYQQKAFLLATAIDRSTLEDR